MLYQLSYLSKTVLYQALMTLIEGRFWLFVLKFVPGRPLRELSL